MRPPNPWQKSSFSSEGSACLEMMTITLDRGSREIRLRESDDPGVVLTTSPARLTALLTLARTPATPGGRAAR